LWELFRELSQWDQVILLLWNEPVLPGIVSCDMMGDFIPKAVHLYDKIYA